ncbi:MAG: methyltransferase domain-containing protein [Acidobacteria bacterium]|nr:methyltransferase domain-containing protein [Acidobacteriota bacterium]
MNESIQFFQAFLKNPTSVGSIAPSSPELARAMVKGIEPGPDNIVLELGVGTGAITKQLRSAGANSENYLGIEIDPSLVRSLRGSFHDLNIVAGDASDIAEIHRRSGLGRVGYIVCCLPFVSLPNDVGGKILAEVEKLMTEGCMFRMYQYAHGYYSPSAIKLRDFMRKRYGRSRRSPLIVKNIPPAYTLTWLGR